MGLLDFGRDTAQAASNSVAGNLSAPVDGIAWLLRKAGINVGGAPFGGSEWMAQNGFTAPVKNQAAGLLGETLGMVTPMAISAKAPQLARGLLQAGENAAAPVAAGPMAAQRGAITWHGSPHKFDKFDANKIGTGEGMQAYGHGLYLADSKDVAKQYFDALNPSADIARAGIDYDGVAQRVLSSADGNRQRAIEELIHRRDMPHVRGNQEWADKMNNAIQYLQGDAKSSNLYKVDLPDEHIAKMLNWDNQVSPSIHRPLSDAAMQQFGSGLSSTSGEHLYNEVIKNFQWAGHANPKEAATSWLSQQGVPGIRYLDGGSRGAGSGTQNTVVFPGNEGLLNILERNGKPLLGD